MMLTVIKRLSPFITRRYFKLSPTGINVLRIVNTTKARYRRIASPFID